MTEIQTKICQQCYSKIDSRAKKCPHCQHWQSKIRTVFYNPAFSIILFISIVLISTWYIGSIFETTYEFDDHKEKIQITDSKMEFGSNSCGETVSIIGKIANTSQIDWRNLTFEVIFYDSKKIISDTEQIEKYSFQLKKTTEIPFKLSLKKEFGDEYYNDYSVRVISGVEKKWPF